MARYHTDLSRVPVSVAPSPATSGTSLGVSDANAAYLPDQYPWWGVLVPTGSSPTRSNAEIVKVTGGSSSGGTTTYTITRAQGSPVTTAQSVTTSFDIYEAIAAEAVGLMSFFDNETPSGTVNGSNTAFTLANTPVTGSLALYRDGQLMKGGGADYSLSGTTITFTTAPVTGSVLLAYYKGIATTAGNADLVDGYHASTTAGVNSIPVLGADSNLPDGVVDTASIEDSAVTATQIANRTRSLWLPASAWSQSEASAVLTAGSIDIDPHWLFDAAATESCVTSFLVPEDWASGSITAKFYFSMVSATSGNVLLHLRWLMVADGGDMTAGGTSGSEDTVAVPGTAGSLKIHSHGNTITGAAAGSILRVCTRRNGGGGADTATGDMRFYGMKLEYTADS